MAARANSSPLAGRRRRMSSWTPAKSAARIAILFGHVAMAHAQLAVATGSQAPPPPAPVPADVLANYGNTGRSIMFSVFEGLDCQGNIVFSERCTALAMAAHALLAAPGMHLHVHV